MRTFIDTNVLVYADDVSAPPKKRRRAQVVVEELIASGDAVVSTQILQEYLSIATRKLRLPPRTARARVELLAALDVVLIRPEMVLAAVDLHLLRPVSFWDALVVRTAIEGGCRRLLTEDLSDGDSFDGVRIENPFR